jgi:hypothetical protein
MTPAKQFAITFISVFLAVLVAVLAPVIRVLYFSDGSGGLAAVSVGVSELLVQSFVLLVAAFLCWRVWRVLRRRAAAR